MEGVREILNTKKIRNTNVSLHHNGEFITNKDRVAGLFNEFFVNIGPNLSINIGSTEQSFMFYMKNNIYNFYIHATNPEEIAKIIQDLDQSKATDIYGMPTKLIKLGVNEISPVLSYLFNYSFCKGIFPDKLKFACVTPVHKGKSKTIISNYRPISVLPTISKILERLVHKRLMNFLVNHNLLFTNQFGF